MDNSHSHRQHYDMDPVRLRFPDNFQDSSSPLNSLTYTQSRHHETRGQSQSHSQTSSYRTHPSSQQQQRHHDPEIIETPKESQSRQRQVHQPPQVVTTQPPRTTTIQIGFNNIEPLNKIVTPAAAELLGTFLYVLLSNLLGMTGNAPFSRFAIAFADGALLMGLIHILSPFGGFHFNPAVTLANLLTLNMRIITGIAVLFVQFFGALIGAVMTRLLLTLPAFSDTFVTLGLLPSPNDAPVAFDADFAQYANRFQIYAMDSILTAFLALTYILSSTNSLTSSVATSCGLARTVTAIIAFQSIGQSNNLARLTANDIMALLFLDETRVWRLFYLYVFAFITGPVLAAIFYWSLNAIRLPRLDATQPVDHGGQR